jgi:hypothetical protein
MLCLRLPSAHDVTPAVPCSDSWDLGQLAPPAAAACLASRVAWSAKQASGGTCQCVPYRALSVQRLVQLPAMLLHLAHQVAGGARESVAQGLPSLHQAVRMPAHPDGCDGAGLAPRRLPHTPTCITQLALRRPGVQASEDAKEGISKATESLSSMGSMDDDQYMANPNDPTKVSTAARPASNQQPCPGGQARACCTQHARGVATDDCSHTPPG